MTSVGGDFHQMYDSKLPGRGVDELLEIRLPLHRARRDDADHRGGVGHDGQILSSHRKADQRVMNVPLLCTADGFIMRAID